MFVYQQPVRLPVMTIGGKSSYPAGGAGHAPAVSTNALPDSWSEAACAGTESAISKPAINMTTNASRRVFLSTVSLLKGTHGDEMSYRPRQPQNPSGQSRDRRAGRIGTSPASSSVPPAEATPDAAQEGNAVRICPLAGTHQRAAAEHAADSPRGPWPCVTQYRTRVCAGEIENVCRLYGDRRRCGVHRAATPPI